MIIKFPPKESNLQKGLAGRGMGMLVNELVVLAVLLAGAARQQLLKLV